MDTQEVFWKIGLILFFSCGLYLFVSANKNLASSSYGEIIIKDGKYGYADAKGRIIVSTVFDEIQLLEGNGIVGLKVRMGDKYGLFTRYGNQASEIVYEKIEPFGRDEYTFMARVHKDGKIGYISLCDELMIPAEFNTQEELESAFPPSVLLKRHKEFLKANKRAPKCFELYEGQSKKIGVRIGFN